LVGLVAGLLMLVPIDAGADTTEWSGVISTESSVIARGLPEGNAREDHESVDKSAPQIMSWSAGFTLTSPDGFCTVNQVVDWSFTGNPFKLATVSSLTGESDPARRSRPPERVGAVPSPVPAERWMDCWRQVLPQ
jgi:hypothetical protein